MPAQQEGDTARLAPESPSQLKSPHLPDDPTPIPMRQDEDKFTLQLESMERQFRDRLLEILPNAARTGSPVFTNTTFNPHNLQTHLFRTDADELLDEAQACLRLREQLGLPLPGSVGYWFLEACQASANLKNPHRRGPRRLAQALLETLSAMP
jgi:hypothetical protein